jgi:hypothetical protein
MKTTVGRTLLTVFAILAAAVSSISAQQPDTGVSLSSKSTDRIPFTSPERIRAALQAEPPTGAGARLFDPTKPELAFPDRLLEHPVIFRLGVLKFVTPSAGLFIDARLPIGELVTHAARSVAAAHHRRAEIAARAEAVKAAANYTRPVPSSSR